MYIARLASVPENQSYSLLQIEQMRSMYSSSQLQNMPFWLENLKSSLLVEAQEPTLIDLSLLNNKQRVAYQIVSQHFHNPNNDPIRLIVTGQGESGKSFLSNALRFLLRSRCIVSSSFGIAS